MYLHRLHVHRETGQYYMSSINGTFVYEWKCGLYIIGSFLHKMVQYHTVIPTKYNSLRFVCNVVCVCDWLNILHLAKYLHACLYIVYGYYGVQLHYYHTVYLRRSRLNWYDSQYFAQFQINDTKWSDDLNFDTFYSVCR